MTSSGERRYIEKDTSSVPASCVATLRGLRQTVSDMERRKYKLLKLCTFTQIQTFGVAERRMKPVEE